MYDERRTIDRDSLSHTYYSFSENLHYRQSLFWKPEKHPGSVRRENVWYFQAKSTFCSTYWIIDSASHSPNWNVLWSWVLDFSLSLIMIWYLLGGPKIYSLHTRKRACATVLSIDVDRTTSDQLVRHLFNQNRESWPLNYVDLLLYLLAKQLLSFF